MIKRISLAGMILFYIGAGINHFWHPNPYYALIPLYLPQPVIINTVSGATEILLGLLLIFSRTRKFAAYGIMVLLLLFIPAHIRMIQEGWCTGTGFCLTGWATWLRLFPGQFILIAWAWWHRKTEY